MSDDEQQEDLRQEIAEKQEAFEDKTSQGLREAK